MKSYKSTDIFVEQLRSGRYPCAVLENDESDMDFEQVAENFKKQISRQGHYDYLLTAEQGDNLSETEIR